MARLRCSKKSLQVSTAHFALLFLFLTIGFQNCSSHVLISSQQGPETTPANGVRAIGSFDGESIAGVVGPPAAIPGTNVLNGADEVCTNTGCSSSSGGGTPSTTPTPSSGSAPSGPALGSKGGGADPSGTPANITCLNSTTVGCLVAPSGVSK